MILKRDNITFLEGYFISKSGRLWSRYDKSGVILLKILGIELSIIPLRVDINSFKEKVRYIIYIG